MASADHTDDMGERHTCGDDCHNWDDCEEHIPCEKQMAWNRVLYGKYIHGHRTPDSNGDHEGAAVYHDSSRGANCDEVVLHHVYASCLASERITETWGVLILKQRRLARLRRICAHLGAYPKECKRRGSEN